MRGSRLLIVAGLALAAGGLLLPLLRDAPEPVLPVSHETAASAHSRPSPELDQARAELPSAPSATTPEAASTPRRVRPGRRVVLWDSEPRPGPPAAIARAVLDEHRTELALDAMQGDLEVVKEFASLSGWHLRLRQTVAGVPVHGSEVSVHVAPDGRPLLVAADIFALGDAALAPETTAAAAAVTARDLVSEDDADEDGPGPEIEVARAPVLVFRPEDKGARLVWMVDLGTADESVRVFVDAVSGDPVATEPLQVADQGSARVFMPNPVYSRRDPGLRDAADQDQGFLTDARVHVTLARLDGTGVLRGTWADATASPNPATSQSLIYTGYTRADPRFEQVMGYYYVDLTQQRLQDLGITNANAESQRLNAHARSDDQSVYDILTDVLEFGDGGVDDAEDADIIVHEYGHALQHAQRPNFGLSGEAGAMGEGFSDFLAVSFHDENDAVYDPAVASWDAVSYSKTNPPALRRVDGNKVYPGDLRGRVHDDGEIWSRFLWDLRGLLGNDASVQVTVESHFWLGPSSSFRDGANAILLANIAVRAGAQDAAIRELLTLRGIPFTVAPPTVIDEDEFEENDSIFDAAPLGVGSHIDLMLADEDWYEIIVPAFSRIFVLATFDPDRIDLDLEVRASASALVAASRGVNASEQVELSAAETPRAYYLRVFDGSTGVGAAGYDLTVQRTELTELEPKVTRVLDLQAHAEPVFSVSVPISKTNGRARLRVKTRRIGKNGALTDLRVRDPEGGTITDFGDLRKRRGARVKVRPAVAGAWVVEIRPRDGTSGAVKVQAKFVR